MVLFGDSSPSDWFDYSGGVFISHSRPFNRAYNVGCAQRSGYHWYDSTDAATMYRVGGDSGCWYSGVYLVSTKFRETYYFDGCLSIPDMVIITATGIGLAQEVLLMFLVEILVTVIQLVCILLIYILIPMDLTIVPL